MAGPAVEPTAKAVRDDGLGYGLFEAACEISVLREPATRGVRQRATGPEILGLTSGALGRPRSGELLRRAATTWPCWRRQPLCACPLSRPVRRSLSMLASSQEEERVGVSYSLRAGVLRAHSRLLRARGL